MVNRSWNATVTAESGNPFCDVMMMSEFVDQEIEASQGYLGWAMGEKEGKYWFWVFLEKLESLTFR